MIIFIILLYVQKYLNKDFKKKKFINYKIIIEMIKDLDI